MYSEILTDIQDVGKSTSKHRGQAESYFSQLGIGIGTNEYTKTRWKGGRSFWQEKASVYQCVDCRICLPNDWIWITTLAS